METHARLTVPPASGSHRRKKCPISPLQGLLCKQYGAKDGGKGCHCGPSGYWAPLRHGSGLVSKPGGAPTLYLYVAWRLSVHVIDDGEVPIEEGVCTSRT